VEDRGRLSLKKTVNLINENQQMRVST